MKIKCSVIAYHLYICSIYWAYYILYILASCMSTSGLVPEFLGDLYVFYNMNRCLKYTSQTLSR